MPGSLFVKPSFGTHAPAFSSGKIPGKFCSNLGLLAAYLKGILSGSISVTPIVPFLYKPKNQRFAIGLAKRAARQL